MKLAEELPPPVFGPNPVVKFSTIAALYGRLGLAQSLGLESANIVGLERLSRGEHAIVAHDDDALRRHVRREPA